VTAVVAGKPQPSVAVTVASAGVAVERRTVVPTPALFKVTTVGVSVPALVVSVMTRRAAGTLRPAPSLKVTVMGVVEVPLAGMWLMAGVRASPDRRCIVYAAADLAGRWSPTSCLLR
jgi:hypothetical protein